MNEHHDKQAKAAVSAGASAEAYAPVADGKPQAGPGEKARQREVERKARAAKKLRENLLKRKQQVRARRVEAKRTILLACLPQKRTNHPLREFISIKLKRRGNSSKDAPFRKAL